MNILEENMLSFELSAIDLILAIAVVILLILYITRPSSSVKTSTQEKLLAEKENPPKKSTKEAGILEKETEKPTTKPQRDSTKCPYGFGYLKKLDKDASIPDQCLSCTRIMECFSANE